jgi:hypothetical protein
MVGATPAEIKRCAEAGLASAERSKTLNALDHSPESGVACLPRRRGSRRRAPHPPWSATSLSPSAVDRDVALPIRRGSRRPSPHPERRPPDPHPVVDHQPPRSPPRRPQRDVEGCAGRRRATHLDVSPSRPVGSGPHGDVEGCDARRSGPHGDVVRSQPHRSPPLRDVVRCATIGRAPHGDVAPS